MSHGGPVLSVCGSFYGPAIPAAGTRNFWETCQSGNTMPVEERIFRFSDRLSSIVPSGDSSSRSNAVGAATGQKLVRHVTFPLPKRCRYGIPRKFFEQSIEKDFEGHSFKIFKHYDKYLKMLYGDYMVLPEPEQRQVHPASKVEL